MGMDRTYVSVPEAAWLLGVPERAVYDLVAECVLIEQTRVGKFRRIDAASLAGQLPTQRQLYWLDRVVHSARNALCPRVAPWTYPPDLPAATTDCLERIAVAC